MSPELTLYHYWRSSSSWRVRWALAHKAITPNYVHVDLLGGESDREPHLSRSPLGYVPAMAVDGRVLIESVAILEWLEETQPQPPLYPGDSYQRAHIRALVEIVNASIQPIQNLNVLDKIPQDPLLRKEWSQYFIRRGFSAFEKVAQKHAGRHAVGDQVTAADLFLIPQCYNAIRFEMDLNEFPLIARLNETGLAASAAMATHPDKFRP